MLVLVTGGGGYIGSVLVPLLLENGHEVKVLDRFFFGEETLQRVSENPKLELIKDDIRWFNPVLLKDVDAVIDLAALSNDPSGELDPSKTMDINYLGRVRVAKLSKEYGVKRYILASSCSIYGFREDDVLLDEESPTNPLTTYAKANLMAESDVLPLSDSNFCVTVLRQATVYGLSPRMRFDLAINGMTLGLAKNKKLPLMRDGSQWRPFVHVKDTSKAFVAVIGAEVDKVNGARFNVGSNEQNFQIVELARLVGDSLPIEYEIEWYGDTDNRSYRVDFGKIKNGLKYRPDLTPREGAVEIYEALESGAVTDSIKTKTVQWYKYLMESYELMQDIMIKDTIL